MTCPICGAAARYLFNYQTYHLHTCTAAGCNHVFVYPTPGPDALEQLYDTTEATLANSDSWTLAQDYQKSPEVVRRLYQRLRIDWLRAQRYLTGPNTSILDVGCSTGMFLRVLADQGFTEVSGLDLSRTHRDYVEEQHRIRCYASLGSLPSARFDLITCYAVLEHTADPLSFLQHIHRALKPEGHVVLLVPNYRSWYSAIAGRHWVWLVPPVHLQYFGPDSLARAIDRGGLHVVEGRSDYSGTYTYLLVHHLMRAIGRPMVSTSRTSRPIAIALANGLEAILRLTLSPISAVAGRVKRHNELLYVAAKPT